MSLNFSVLLGKTISKITISPQMDEIVFFCSGEKYKMYHEGECCEQVSIEDIDGDIRDIIGAEILRAEEAVSREHPDQLDESYDVDSFTWTYYKLDTIRGGITIRWYGTSNGYYSESVTFEKVT